MMLSSLLLITCVISSCIGSPQELVKESIVGEEDALMRRTGLGHHGYGGGTSCLVKGSYCSCHYCKCEHGSIHCHAGKGFKGVGKHYCYGSMEGEHCHCDYCKCRHGYGIPGHHARCGGDII